MKNSAAVPSGAGGKTSEARMKAEKLERRVKKPSRQFVSGDLSRFVA